MNLRSSLTAAAFAALLLAAALPAAAAPTSPDRGGIRGNFELVPVQPPALDLDAIAAEDEAREVLDQAPRFAIPEPVSLTPRNSGVWERLPDGRAIWRLRVESVNANSLNFGFGRYKMSPGGTLTIKATDESRSIRRFTARDNEEHGQLWTPVLPGRDAVIELVVPQREIEKVELELTSINQGYRGFGTASLIKSGSCNLDIAYLDPADPWVEVGHAAANISTGGSAFCSGSLINNTAGDHKMYFVTANHCGISAGVAPSLVAYWNYENSFCRTPGTSPSGQAGDGTFTQFHTGSIFRASFATSDFTLVELDDPAVEAFHPYWPGWDRNTGDFTCTPAAPCACIHYPNNDEKRITYVITNTATTSYNGTTSPGNGSHVWAHWATDPPGPFTVPGVTEPGSSGSPLYTAERRYIGQLHGGPSSCGATGNSLSDYYGRFSVSWAGGGTNSTRASNWLDPLGTAPMTLDGIGLTDATIFADGFETGTTANWAVALQ